MRFRVLPWVALALAVSAAGGALAQILPKDAADPIRVTHSKGEFAQKLNGLAMPTGKGWKAAMDSERLLQLMIPEKWKVENVPSGELVLRAYPPGQEKKAKAVLQVTFTVPRDADPFSVDEDFAESYAEDLGQDPMFQRLQYRVTDSGFVLARGMKFALAGGILNSRGSRVQQEQLLYIAEDRIVSIHFTAEEKEFPKYADDVAKIFASYHTLGVRKLTEEPPALP
ncbi:MAG: hypothetical protein ACK47B_03765 [Armatimonadota bacterium]